MTPANNAPEMQSRPVVQKSAVSQSSSAGNLARPMIPAFMQTMGAPQPAGFQMISPGLPVGRQTRMEMEMMPAGFPIPVQLASFPPGTAYFQSGGIIMFNPVSMIPRYQPNYP